MAIIATAGLAVPASAGAATVQDPEPDVPASDEGAVRAPSRSGGATIARIVVRTRARRRLQGPDSGPVVATTTSWSQQPQTLLVLARAHRGGRDWVRLLLPSRPSGSTAWVPRDHVVLGRTRWWIDVQRSTRTVRVRNAGRVRARFRAVVGAPGTPTPTGLSAVWERNLQPSPDGFTGSWVLSLTALSPVLEDFGGGPGRIGLHGRGGSSLADPLGTARSHGCVRVSNAAIDWIARRVPVGTPVLVRD